MALRNLSRLSEMSCVTQLCTRRCGGDDADSLQPLVWWDIPLTTAPLIRRRGTKNSPRQCPLTQFNRNGIALPSPLLIITPISSAETCRLNRPHKSWPAWQLRHPRLNIPFWDGLSARAQRNCLLNILLISYSYQQSAAFTLRNYFHLLRSKLLNPHA